MIDINDIAALLHVEEKLRAHGNKFAAMHRAVVAKLDEHEATHKKAEEPEPVEEPVVEEPVEEVEETEQPQRRL